MFIGIFLVFIGGWATWFWIDKPPAGQFGLPPAGDSIVGNFQRSMDLLKAGYPDMAYLYIWHAHYLILSVVFGILLAAALRTISDHLARISRRRHNSLPGIGTSRVGNHASRERPVVPRDGDNTAVNGGSSDHTSR